MFEYHNPPDIQSNIQTPAKSEDKKQDFFEIDRTMDTSMDDQKARKSIDDKSMDTTLEYKEITVSFPEYQIKYLERKEKEGFDPSEIMRDLLDKKMNDDFFKQY